MLDLNEFTTSLKIIVEQTRDKMVTIRTGRASPALIENTPVLAYGGQTTLKLIELATITNEGPQSLLVIPFDPSVTQDIEKTLRALSIGLAVSVSGTQIRVKTPPLTEEQRQKYAKLVSEISEEGRESIRRERDEIRKKVKSQYDGKEIGEDVKYRLEEEIDKISKDYTDQIESIKKRKEQEILTI
jgi:ribosome recycling factor